MRGNQRVDVFSRTYQLKRAKVSFIYFIAHKMKLQELISSCKSNVGGSVFEFLERKKAMHWNILRFKSCRISKSAVTHVMFS